MILFASMSNRCAAVMAAVWLCTPMANAQLITGDTTDGLVAAQLKRVQAAVARLAPFQLTGCWQSARVQPLIGLSKSDGTGLQVNTLASEAGTPLVPLHQGDLLVSIDGKAVKQEGFDGQRNALTVRRSPYEDLRKSGRTFVETYKNSRDQEIAIENPVRLDCTASDIHVGKAKSDSAATRLSFSEGYFGLSISSSSLALFDDDQLLAFMAWNHAFMALRHETSSDSLEFLTFAVNGRAAKYSYFGSAHEKIDWVTLTTLLAMNGNLHAYGTMLSVVDTFNKNVGFSFRGSKRFIQDESGGSPFGGEEKQMRLAAWVKLLEQDALAPSPQSLQFSNLMLSVPTWTSRTVPLKKYQTVAEALQYFLGEDESKLVAARYMSSADFSERPAERPVAGHLGKAPSPPVLQMIYAHHPTKRLMWIGPSKPTMDQYICARSGECSIIVVGPHVVARPSPAWSKELSETPREYKLEEVK